MEKMFEKIKIPFSKEEFYVIKVKSSVFKSTRTLKNIRDFMLNPELKKKLLSNVPLNEIKDLLNNPLIKEKSSGVIAFSITKKDIIKNYEIIEVDNNEQVKKLEKEKVFVRRKERENDKELEVKEISPPIQNVSGPTL